MQFTTRFYCFFVVKNQFFHTSILPFISYYRSWTRQWHVVETCQDMPVAWLGENDGGAWLGGDVPVARGWEETCRWRVSTLIFFFLFLLYFSVLTQKSTKRSQERPIAQPLDARGRPSFVSIETIWVADAWCLSGCLLLIRDGIMRRAGGASLHICGLYTHYIFADTQYNCIYVSFWLRRAGGASLLICGLYTHL